MNSTNKPDPSEYPPYAQSYIDAVTLSDLESALIKTRVDTVELLHTLTDDKAGFTYAPGKWTIREVIGHINDAERIFCYRALRFARLDFTELPGFDENLYVENAHSNLRTIEEIGREFQAIRDSTLTLFNQFSAETMRNTGKANKASYSVRGLGWMIAGHNAHHLKIIRERYF